MSQFRCPNCDTLIETAFPGAAVTCRRCGRQEPAAWNSGLGVASFMIALFVGVPQVLMFLAILFHTPVGANAAAMGGFSLASLAVPCVGIGAVPNLVGLGLGFWGLSRKDCKRTLARVGVSLNGALLLAVGVLFLGALFRFWYLPG